MYTEACWNYTRRFSATRHTYTPPTHFFASLSMSECRGIVFAWDFSQSGDFSVGSGGDSRFERFSFFVNHTFFRFTFITLSASQVHDVLPVHTETFLNVRTEGL